MPLPVLLIPILSLISMLLVLIASWQFQNLDPQKHFFTSKISSILQAISSKLAPGIRLYVLVLSLIWAIGVFAYSYFSFPETDALIKNLVRVYGFTGLFLLFAALTPGMIRVYFPAFIFDSLLIKSRRSIGLSAYLFALTHGALALIYYFDDSLQKVQTLSVPYQYAFYFALASLIILTPMAITSFDKIVALITFQRWKLLHRFIYLAFLLSLLHSFIRGTHLNEPFITFSSIMVFLSLTFILLEIGSTAIYVINHNYQKSRLKSYMIFAILGIIGFTSFYLSLIKLEQLY